MIDTTPQCVRDVLDKPGRYRFDQKSWHWFFEVDDKRRVYQLDPRTKRRDGILSPDGWADHAQFGVVSRVLDAG